MSLLARKSLIDRCQFLDDAAKADILDPTRTNTWLIAALLDVAPCLITSVRSDHSDDSLIGAHGHARGWAADIWSISAEPIEKLLARVAGSLHIWTVGLGGASIPFLQPADSFATIRPFEQTPFRWPTDNRFVLFRDNSTDHVHIQAGNAYGEGLR